MLPRSRCSGWLADLERHRAALVFGEPLIATTGGRRATAGSARGCKAAAHDPQRWKDIAYLRDLQRRRLRLGHVWLDAVGLRDRQHHAARVVVGDAGRRPVPGAGRSTPGRRRSAPPRSASPSCRSRCSPSAASPLSQAHLARWLLAPSLAARVERLTETRAGAVDVAAAELHRIERDLHDGAQARLVALAMDLGMAEERFDRDPESAKRARRRGARGGQARAGRAARPRARHPAEPARRARARAGDRRARRPQPRARARRPATSRAARPRTSRRPPGSSSPRRSRTPPSTAAPPRATVWVTLRHGDLHVEVVDDGRGGADPNGAGLQGPRPARRGARRLARGQQPARRADGGPGGAAVRVVIAEDLALLRDGLERLLRDSGFDVVAAVADGDALLDRRRGAPARTSRSSTSGSRPRSATRACAPRSSCAAAGPASRC